MPKTKITFLEGEKWQQDYLRVGLKSVNGLTTAFFDKPLNPSILKKIKDSQALVIFVASEIDANVVSQLPKLKFIATMSTGFDHIDLSACKSQGIKVSNVPLYGAETVAEHTFALILSLSRKIPQSIEKTARGDFRLDGLRGFDLNGKTIGIVGLGHIGENVAEIACGFNMKILVADPNKIPSLAKKYGIKYVSLDYLLANSDIISLHAPYNKQTHHLINKNNIKKIKSGAMLINTARGGLVDTEALLIALEKDDLAGCGLDVLEEECFIREETELLTKPFQETCNLKTALQSHHLTHHPKAIVTPHNAFNSHEALQRILDTTLDNVKAFLHNKPINLVK